MEDLLKVAVIVFIIVAAAWEFAVGRGKDGRRTKKDWQMAILATFMMAVVQRPILAIAISVGSSSHCCQVTYMSNLPAIF
mgnify:CR=1 FL=1